MSLPPTLHRFSCLILDDDASFAETLALLVRAEGGEPLVTASVGSARAALLRETFQIAVLDNRLPDGSGFDFYPHLRSRCPDAVVVMITGAPELSQAVELTRNGLFDYLTKPLKGEAFVDCLRRGKLRLARPDLEPATDLVGNSSAMNSVRRFLHQAAPHALATVLLLGETGTGKELAARLLHQLTFGERAERTPFIAVNCSAIPGEIFEAELFGSERGAYTGADRKRVGLLEAAGAGTLFLDEIGETPLALQTKLLRVLDSREYRTLGSNAPKKFAGRIVAATNRSLRDEVRAGRFREDLLFRLDVMSTTLPVLREHIEDLPALAEATLEQLCVRYGRQKPLLRPAELEALRAYHFPGNVRELRNLLERSLLKSRADSHWLSLDLEWLHSSDAQPQTPGSGVELPPQLTAVETEEYKLLARALREEAGGIRRAAAKVGMSHQTVIRRLERWPELRKAAGME